MSKRLPWIQIALAPVYWLITFAVLFLSGCASTPIEAPRSTLFQSMQPAQVEMPGPAELASRPRAVLANTGDASNALMCFDGPAAQNLIQRDMAGEANTGIASECSAAFSALQKSHNQLLQQAKLLEQQYNATGQHWADAEEQLKDAQRDSLIEIWLHRLAILGLLGLAL